MDVFELRSMITCGNGQELIQLSSMMCRNLVYIIPKNTSLSEIELIAKSVDLKFRVEDIYLHGRLKMKVVYFGDILGNTASCSNIKKI